MFRRLFSANHEFDKVFDECKVDTSHQLIHVKQILQLAGRYLEGEERQNIHINIKIENNVNNNINININNAQKDKDRDKKYKKKQQFIEYFVQKLQTKHMVLLIKMLVVGHSIARKFNQEHFNETFIAEIDKFLIKSKGPTGEEEEGRRDKGQVEVKVENTKEDFMQRNIIQFYCHYIKKFILNFDTYLFAKAFDSKISQSLEPGQVIGVLNRGFVVLNLVNYILRSQQTFNKMGRYYLPHKQLLALFIKYLQDLIVYNSFIKKVTALSIKNIKEAGDEQVKHHFLFVTQAQKTSDRLYEFFYNRYYYSEIRSIMLMPTFLTIHAQDYKELVAEVKKKDRELVVLVKKSKYQVGGRSYSCAAKTTRTEQEQRQHFKTESNSLSLNYSLSSTEEESAFHELKKCQPVQRKRCKTVSRQ